MDIELFFYPFISQTMNLGEQEQEGQIVLWGSY